MAQAGKSVFTGLFRHTLDDKGRLTIPSGWRHAHAQEDTFLATPFSHDPRHQRRIDLVSDYERDRHRPAGGLPTRS